MVERADANETVHIKMELKENNHITRHTEDRHDTHAYLSREQVTNQFGHCQ